MENNYEEIRRECRNQLLEQIDYTKDIRDEEIRDLIDDCVLRVGKTQKLSLQIKNRLQRELFATIRQLDVLEEFLADNSVTEIMVNGPDCIFIERDGSLTKVDVHFESQEKLTDVIQQIVAKVNRVVNEASPIVHARLSGGARVHVVMPPIALNGPILTIRRFPDHPICVEDYYRFGSLNEEVMEFIKKLIKAKYNIFISGGTGSGKTTFLNVLSGFIPTDERIVTIEDNAELQIRNIENLVRLETRNANIEGCMPVTIRDLIKASLRMRPDRIIVGEIRDEYDEDEEELIREVGEREYLVEGSMKLDDINDQLGTELMSEDYDSIGGLLIENLDRLPEDGETITLENGITLQVKGINQNRIINVLMTLPEESGEEETDENKDLSSKDKTSEENAS